MAMKIFEEGSSKRKKQTLVESRSSGGEGTTWVD